MKIMDPLNPPKTDEDAMQYLPDRDEIAKAACRGLFLCHRAQGETVMGALREVYKAFLGERKP